MQKFNLERAKNGDKVFYITGDDFRAIEVRFIGVTRDATIVIQFPHMTELSVMPSHWLAMEYVQ